MTKTEIYRPWSGRRIFHEEVAVRQNRIATKMKRTNPVALRRSCDATN
jgi:hypothetical protein